MNRRSVFGRLRDQPEPLEPRLLLTAGTGLFAQYFSDSNLSQLVAERVDTGIDFDWSHSSPSSAINADSFSVRWSGELEAPFTETYEFFLNADDRARLWLNGQLLIDRMDEHTPGSVTSHDAARVDLIAGRRYEIQLEYRGVTDDAAVRLEWSSSSLHREVVPRDRLFPVARGADFQKQLRGILHAPESGPYQFQIAASGPADLWLSNSSEPSQKRLIARSTLDASRSSEPVLLVAGQSYYIEATQQEPAASQILVQWKTPSGSKMTSVHGQHLSPVVPEVRLYAEAPRTFEGGSPATLTVIRSDAPFNQPLVVRYTIRGSATNGTDYATLPGEVTIPAGAKSATIRVTAAIDDFAHEGEERVIVELLSDVTYQVGLTSERTVTVNIQDDARLPAGGTSLFDSTALDAFRQFGGAFATVSDPQFDRILQAKITVVPLRFYSAQLQHPIDRPVTTDDQLLAEFYVRSLDGRGKVTVVFETNGPPYDQSLFTAIPVTTAWQKIQLPFTSKLDYSAGAATFSFQLGHQLQTLQFADIKVVNYGPPGDMLGSNRLRTINLGGSFGVEQTVPVSGQGFTAAQELKTNTRPPETYQFQIYGRNVVGISAGERMRVEYWARSTASVDATVEAMILRTTDFSGLIYQRKTLSRAWQKYTFDLAIQEGFDADGLQLNFHAGFDPQTIEIGGVTWTNLDRPLDSTSLPTRIPSTTYGGRLGTAAWRDEANQRIQAERAADLTVNVVDVHGQPLNGVVVIVRQTQHAFLFGTAVNGASGRLAANAPAEAQKYQSEIKRLFNAATDEYLLQWIPLLQDLQRGFNVANFAADNELYMRGHSGIWPSRRYMPDSVWDRYDSLLNAQGAAAAEDYLRSATLDRISLIATTFADVTDEWDVVNEPRVNNDVMQILGDGILVDWFSRFRALDPTARLTLNEYGLFSDNGQNTDNLASFQYWLDLLAKDELVDFMGEQSHYNVGNLTDIPILGQLISNLHARNQLPINITELDVDTTDVQLQADYLRDYMTMAFSQPAIAKIMQWGFWEGRHWLPNSALYRHDFSIKPNGQAYEDLVFGSWWTDARGTTLEGVVTTHAFLGEYEVLVQYAGEVFRFAHRHDAASELTAILPLEPVDYDIGLAGDLSMDGLVDQLDIDLLAAAMNRGQPDRRADLNRDQIVNSDDLDYLIEEILHTKKGDVNLDGKVGFVDFLVLSSNFGKTEDGDWSSGDFDLDSKVSFADFLVLSANFDN